MNRLVLPLAVAAALVLAGCSSANHTGSSASVGHRSHRGMSTTTTTTISTTTVPALPPTIPVETDSNALVTFADFTVCSLRPDPVVLGGGVDATASGTATLHPPAGGGDVEMDIVDSSGNVLEGGPATPLQSYVFSGQPVSLETVFPSTDGASACVVRWVTPTTPSSQGTARQLPTPPTTTPTPTTYPVLP